MPVTAILHHSEVTFMNQYARTELLLGEDGMARLHGARVALFGVGGVGGHAAEALVEGQLELDEGGYIRAGESTETGIPGVYAVGDVRTKALRQIVTATADGAIAAHYAESYLSHHL